MHKILRNFARHFATIRTKFAEFLLHYFCTILYKAAKNSISVVRTAKNFTTLHLLQGSRSCKRNHLCLICLRAGYCASECQTTKSCRHCNKRHHQSICDQSSPNQETSTTSIANDKSENSQVTATAALRKRGTVLLQTATAVATNEDGTKMTKARILFDSGSHRFYITNDLKSRLKLKSYRTEMLNLNTFGEQK